MLPKGWVETKLGDVATIQSGYAFKSEDYASSGSFLIRIGNVQDGHISQDNPRYVNLDEKTSNFSLMEGDVLISLTGNIGRVSLVPVGILPAALNQRVGRILFSKNTSKDFFIYFLRSFYFRSQINNHARGAAQQNISPNEILTFSVSLPPLAEQRRIVAKLDSLTARIACARAELERAKRLQKQWFSKFLDSEFSCDGELLRLGELAEDVRYGTAQKCDYNPTLTPVLRIPNIASGNIDTSDLKHSTFTEKEIKKLSLCSGDLLIVRSNGSIDLVGQSAVADTQVSGFLFAGYLIRIRLKNKEVTPYFVHYWLRSPQARSAINAAAKSTSGVNNINSEQLKNLQIKIPSLSKQRIIVSRVIKAFSHAERLETEAERVLALLDRLESSLLAKAFRGELVPQDPDDEPASVLLDRIQAERAAAPKPKRGRKQSTQDMPVPRKRQTEKHG